MFDSGYSAEKIICEIESETNIAFPVDRTNYVTWINAFEQPLYSDIICEQRTSELPFKTSFFAAELDFCAYDEDVPRAGDIKTIFCVDKDGRIRECERVSMGAVSAGICSKYAYVGTGERFLLHVPDAESEDKIRVIRHARPVPKQLIGESVAGNIALPADHLEMLRCKLRGEKYRLLNEDTLCAKWIDEYNARLEDFKTFIALRMPEV